MKRSFLKNVASGIHFNDLGARACLAVGLAASFAQPAWAGRPLATEDAGVLGRGTCEFESYAGRIRGGDSERMDTRWAQFGCGIGLGTQLALGAGREDADGERSRPAAFAGKTFIRELTDEQAGISLAYAFSGALEQGDRFLHDATELKAVVSVPLARWLLHANLGSQYSKAEQHYSTVWGLAVERAGAIGPVDLMAELVGDDRAAPWLQVAARWAVVPERVYLDASWGARTDSVGARQITVGLKIAF